MLSEEAIQAKMASIERLVRGFEGHSDPTVKELARELVQTLLDVHAAGLGRMLQIIARSNGSGSVLIESLADDGLIASLMLLHGLHPVDFATRVRRGLDQVAPYLRAHGADVEVLAIAGTVVRLRLRPGQRPSAVTHLKLAIEEAIVAQAPDLARIDIEEPEGETNHRPTGRTPLPLLGRPG